MSKTKLKVSKINNSKTLVAIATPLGEGGIGVIQVSGPHSLEIVGRLFKGKRVRDITQSPSGGLFYGTLEACSERSESNSSGMVDEVVVSVWRAGDSPTGEDLVEVNCHGGIRAVRRTLAAILEAGAKEAKWPELLDQALHKGRLDLVQKEAIEALLQAKTRLCVKVLLWQYQGALSRAISTLETRVKALDCQIVVAPFMGLDKSSRAKGISALVDNYNSATSEETNKGLSELLAGIKELLDSSPFGLALTCPQKVTIAGVPNVGKSTLFNLLLREERAIVHPEPGTTRDYVSEYLSIRGIPFELVDSAGVRDVQGQVEREGVERAMALHKQADKIILVLDNSRPLSQDERLLIKELDPKKVVPVINKIDLDLVGARCNVPLLEGLFLIPPVRLSALKGQGLEGLEAALIRGFQKELDLVGARCNVPSLPIVFTPRQRQVLSEVRDRLKGLLGASATRTGELFAKDLGLIRDALRNDLLGISTTDLNCSGRVYSAQVEQARPLQ